MAFEFCGHSLQNSSNALANLNVSPSKFVVGGLVPGPWSLVRGPWSLGPWSLVPGTICLDLGTLFCYE